jgi:hypothetical protein
VSDLKTNTHNVVTNKGNTMTYICDCGHPESPHSDITRGYGRDAEGLTFCYDCCAERDREQMRKDGKTCLYLVKREDGHHVTNWPASLDIKVNTGAVRVGRHNIAGRRYDVWFWFEGDQWHGVQYGDNTQILHARRLKRAA